MKADEGLSRGSRKAIKQKQETGDGKREEKKREQEEKRRKRKSMSKTRAGLTVACSGGREANLTSLASIRRGPADAKR